MCIKSDAKNGQQDQKWLFVVSEILSEVKRIVPALMPSLFFRCFSLFLPHLRTLAQGKRSENCLRFGTGGPSLCLYPLLSRNILFFPALTMAARARKNIFGEAISVHYRDFEHAYVYLIWLRGSDSYVITHNGAKLSENWNHPTFKSRHLSFNLQMLPWV